MANLVTNADDVEVFLKAKNPDNIEGLDQGENGIRVIGDEFTLETAQDISSVSGFSQNKPKGLTKGDIEYEFDFSIEGENVDVMRLISDAEGDSRPFEMRATKSSDVGNDAAWEYAFELCLADSEEISGTTGETIGLSVEGMAAGRRRTFNPGG